MLMNKIVPPPTHLISDYVEEMDLMGLIEAAKHEDLGINGIDITSYYIVDQDKQAVAMFRPRQAGIFCGGQLIPQIIQAYDSSLELDVMIQDGEEIKADDHLAMIRGSLASILKIERIALNFINHLSGIATTTRAYVDQTAGFSARITDTRKTIPGLRGLAKYAVACGGGLNHRIGLYDAILLKDNHLVHLPKDDLGKTIKQIVVKTQEAEDKDYKPAFFEIEVDTLTQYQQVLHTGVDIILLDNMDLDQIKQAVQIRDQTAPSVLLEASGGIGLEQIKPIAETGVDRIAVGAITHSAQTLDIGLDIL